MSKIGCWISSFPPFWISFRSNVFVGHSGKRIEVNYILIRTEKAEENYCSTYMENYVDKTALFRHEGT